MTVVMKKSAADLVCVMLDVHIWSGRRHLEKTDLIYANPEFRKLPEKELANLGSVKICDPEDIKRFQTIKGKAERVLRRAGLPILGAIGVPMNKFEEVHDELVKLQAEFNTLLAIFLSAFEMRVSEWKIKHTIGNPGWVHLFGSIPSATHVAGRIAFDFHPYRISAPADDLKPELNARYEEQMVGLKGELLTEVSNQASTLMSDYLMGKDAVTGVVKKREFVTPKTLGPLKRAADKLSNFSFLDPSIGPLADVIKETLREMPTVGRIDGKELIKIWSLARMLSSPLQAAEMASVAAGGMSTDDLLDSIQQAASIRSTDSLISPATGLQADCEETEVKTPMKTANALGTEGNMASICDDLASLF